VAEPEGFDTCIFIQLQPNFKREIHYLM